MSSIQPAAAPERRAEVRAAVIAIMGGFAGFCWLVADAPAVASLSVAIAAAIAWCVWLESQPHRSADDEA